MQIAMLGPLEVRPDSGDPRAISGARLARLLIVLALHPGEVVTTGSVVDAVWATDPPDEPANAIQALVSRLRRAAPGLEVVSRAQGYVLDVAPVAVDVREFERLVVEGRRVAPGDPASAAVTLRRALDMWRGPALVDDLYAAVRYATAAGDARRATQLVGSLGWYWWMRGHRSEGVELVKGALALGRDEVDLTGPELEEQAIAYTIGALLTVDGTKEMSLALR
ncbi:MAG TPA: BTAD domain-containing putative transcriptional regulator, partial [Micromonosporaceae bacterium]|nr:BTAD domain-containing putative transcriptional regulator [Micromonosporaceae bacterium]